MPKWLYVVACIALPAVWGLVVSALYDAIADRRAARRPADEAPEEMWHI